MPKAYRMVTPPNADPATLRWVAEHCDALAAQNANWAVQTAADHPDASGRYAERGEQAKELAHTFRVRASRIEGKQKRARGKR